MHPDDIDQRILDIIAKDGRIALKRLAALVGLSRSAVTARLKRLEDSGAILGYRAVVAGRGHARPTGALPTRALLLVRIAKTPAYDLVESLAVLPGVAQIRSLAGDIDLAIDVEAGDVDALNRLRDTISVLPGVIDCRTHLVLATHLDPAQPVL